MFDYLLFNKIGFDGEKEEYEVFFDKVLQSFKDFNCDENAESLISGSLRSTLQGYEKDNGKKLPDNLRHTLMERNLFFESGLEYYILDDIHKFDISVDRLKIKSTYNFREEETKKEMDEVYKFLLDNDISHLPSTVFYEEYSNLLNTDYLLKYDNHISKTKKENEFDFAYRNSKNYVTLLQHLILKGDCDSILENLTSFSPEFFLSLEKNIIEKHLCTDEFLIDVINKLIDNDYKLTHKTLYTTSENGIEQNYTPIFCFNAFNRIQKFSILKHFNLFIKIFNHYKKKKSCTPIPKCLNVSEIIQSAKFFNYILDNKEYDYFNLLTVKTQKQFNQLIINHPEYMDRVVHYQFQKKYDLTQSFQMLINLNANVFTNRVLAYLFVKEQNENLLMQLFNKNKSVFVKNNEPSLLLDDLYIYYKDGFLKLLNNSYKDFLCILFTKNRNFSSNMRLKCTIIEKILENKIYLSRGEDDGAYNILGSTDDLDDDLYVLYVNSLCCKNEILIGEVAKKDARITSLTIYKKYLMQNQLRNF